MLENVGRDFNGDIIFVDEIGWASHGTHFMEDFRRALVDFDIVGLPYSISLFTWSNNRLCSILPVVGLIVFLLL